MIHHDIRRFPARHGGTPINGGFLLGKILLNDLGIPPILGKLHIESSRSYKTTS